jgi:hypothetical protein
MVAEPPAKFDWRNPNVYFDKDDPPSPSRTRSQGWTYDVNRKHCLSRNETHIPLHEHQVHDQVVGIMTDNYHQNVDNGQLALLE